MVAENIRLAFHNFATSRMRAFLSVLGVVIGVASVIAITTLGRSATISVQAEIARSGLGTIVVDRRSGGEPRLIRQFTPELVRRLEREVPGIHAVTPLQIKSALMRHGDRQHRGNVMALSEESVGIFDLTVIEGRFFSSEDQDRRRSVVVLGAETARQLFPTSSPIGRYVRLYLNPARSFQVIGVIDYRPDALGLSYDMSVFVPFETYANRVEKVRIVSSYAVGVRNASDVLVVTEEVSDFFRELAGGSEKGYKVLSPSTVAELFGVVTTTLNAFLTGIAAISLLVGGVGIMNIMLVSVTERTKEIGIRKALGASPAVIRGQFLTEAVTLTLSGGLIGIVLGTGLSYLGTWLLGWTFTPSPGAYPLAMIFSTAVGIFFGLYPAIRASRLDPVAALSYE